MSRADREKVMYLARLNQIREELRRAYPEEALLKQIVQMRGKEAAAMQKRADAGAMGGKISS